jgi:hypothetical protein
VVSWKAAAALAVVLAGLVAYLVLSQPRSHPQPAPFLPCDPATAVSLQVQGQAQGQTRTFAMERGDDLRAWQVTQPVRQPAEGTAADVLVESAEGVQVLNTLGRPAALSQYGLDRPRDVVTCRVKAGTSFTLSVGNPSFDSSGYYARKEGDSRVYVISGVQVEALERALTAPPVSQPSTSTP